MSFEFFELFVTEVSVCAYFHFNYCRLNPDYDQALNNLANLLKDKDQNAEAEKLLLRAVEIKFVFLMDFSM